MSNINAKVGSKYRIACLTDNTIEYDWSISPPTECPIDPGHSIGGIDIIEENLFFIIDHTDSPYNLKTNSLFANSTVANVSINLPDTEKAIGSSYVIKNTGNSSNYVILNPKSPDTINGNNSYIISSLDQTVIKANVSNWDIVSLRDADEIQEIEKSVLLLLANVCLAELNETTGIIPTQQSGDLNNHTDISITSPITNQVLTFNGNEWVNANVSGNTGDDVTLNSIGTGESIVAGNTGPNLSVKGIVSGNTDYIQVSNTATDIVIDLSENLINTSFITTESSLFPNSSILQGNTNISVINTNGNTTISFTGNTGDDVTLNSVGNGTVDLVASNSGPNLEIYKLQSGNGIDIDLIGNVVDISANLETIYLSSTAIVNTSVNANIVIGGMTTTPPAGKYYVHFGGTGLISTGSIEPYYAISKGGPDNIITGSRRFHGWGGLGGSRVPISSHAVIETNGSETVSTIFNKGTKGGGNSYYRIYNRNMTLIRLA